MRVFVLAALAVCPALAQISVTTHHYDAARTGVNLSENVLNTSNVNSGQFGMLFSYPADGFVFAQPLYVPAVPISGGGTHNVVYFVTMNNSVYAYDADSNTGANASPLWMRNYNDAAAGITPVPSADVQGPTDISGTIGILSTPVIDAANQVMYFLVRTKENGAYFQRLHAVDIRSGIDIANSPAVITAAVSNSSGGTVTFDPKIQNQRPALALANGLVYIAWGSHTDLGPFHGWVMAYSTYSSGSNALQQKYVLDTTLDGTEGGIWQGGSGPVIDPAGNLYYGIGNGDWDGRTNFGQSVVKLSPTLQVLDYFTPDTWQVESNNDQDLAPGGMVLLPGGGPLVESSKTGFLFVLSTQNMGHLASGNTQITQALAAANGHIHSGPIYWNSPALGPLLYIWSENDYLKAFHFNGTTFDTTPLMTSGFKDGLGMPGGFLTLSAKGTAAGSAVLWVNMPFSLDAQHQVVPGILRAFDANNLSTELWNSYGQRSRDDFGNFAKFTPPVVVNGKVYMATFSNKVAVYGLLATATTGVFENLSASTLAINPGSPGSVQANITSSGALPSSISVSASGVPSGVSVQFNPVAINGNGSSTVTFSASAAAAPGSYPITISATSGSYSASQPLTLTVVQVSSSGLQINSGGGTVAPFIADANFSGGNASSTANQVDTSAVTNPAPQAVYQSERWGGAFTYTIPNLTAAKQYTVRLHFAETTFGGAGQRVFNVAINGTTVLQNFDIVVAAGGTNKAVVKQFTATANGSGQIGIGFITGSVNYPKICGIEILAASAPPPPPSSLQIDSGGGAAGTFIADADFSGGYASSTTNPIDISGVTNPAPQAVYQSERWGNITYTIPNLTAAKQYTVRLHFAETFFGGAGQRMFNVAINGTSVLQNFDIVAAAGAANKAIVKQFTATANSSGQVVIAFTIGTANNPKISGIEIAASSTPPPVSLQVNSGGAAATPFIADADFSGGYASSTTNQIDTSAVTNPAPQAVYQSERWGNITYTIPNLTAAKQYTVRLHFAETFFTAAGLRMFNVAINGTTVLQNFDIVAAAGAANKAIVKQFTATANSSGQVVIAFTLGTANNPKISGIEIQ